MKIFRYRFLRNFESCKVETWYILVQWADVSCIQESGPRANNSWSYIPWYVSQYCHLWFVTLFSRTVRATKLTPVAHMDSGLIYCVNQNQSIPLGVKTIWHKIKKNHYRFLKNYESCKVETWYTHGQWAVVSYKPVSRPRAYNFWS